MPKHRLYRFEISRDLPEGVWMMMWLVIILMAAIIVAGFVV